MYVKVRFTDGKTDDFMDVVEVHYGYRPGRVAIECADTGHTYDLEGWGHGILEVAEIEIFPQGSGE